MCDLKGMVKNHPLYYVKADWVDGFNAKPASIYPTSFPELLRGDCHNFVTIYFSIL